MDINTYNLKNALSPYDQYCDGYGNIGASGNSYILGLTMGVGVTDISFSHQGSQLLDEINAFDLAEIDECYIGQINMSSVSSFCGSQGLIWGYDLVKIDTLYSQSSNPLFKKPLEYKGQKIKVFDANNLVEATKKLLGTKDGKRFVLRPGSHVPFAGRCKYITNKGTIYAAVALGISSDRENNACLLMEDIGVLSASTFHIDSDVVLGNLAKSIIEIGHNQKIEFTECFVAIKTCEVGNNQIGCALVAAPYFTLAKNAVLKKRFGNLDFNKMFTVSLSEWENRIF